ncbi:hypothetical protein [Xanthomonas phage Olaya]|nr:hypothetical protein [Xanthomonas phage Olaya]QTZ82507.1 hypothetical protein [Xanthomonas phage Usaquen]QTZ82562.1 hypothetical protein [Xanthomonas phage Alcala]QTZ82615.1 hypothetical protein [Xanthomonas phage Fontebon]CAA2366827.1 hypothetical protein [Xylella phage Usme]
MNEKLKEAISEAIREALGGALDCTRVWSAWGVGTMSEDDFSPVADDSERVGEIADAVMAVLTTRKLVCETCSGWGMIGGPSFYAPDEGGEPCPDCNARQAVDLGRLERFETATFNEGGNVCPCMDKDGTGTWVRFDDVAALIDGKGSQV